ncbi:MAG: M23 family metallopeptidase [Thermodesulfobacteriota bacterium]|nr:M23 family metallopeptidase [Thermodesulfobacteriota bacterium]
MKSNWTILVIPDSTNSPKRLKMTSLRIGLVLSLFIGLFIFSIVAGLMLFNLKSDISRIALLKKKNLDQKHQLTVLAEKVASIDNQFKLLTDFNIHLRDVANIDRNGSEGIVAVGGGGGTLMGSNGKPEIITENILARNLHSHIKQLSDNIQIEEEISKKLLAQLERQRSLMAHTPSVWPARGWLTSPFGWRRSPFTGEREFHKGVDIAARKGTPVYAPADGMVTSYGTNGGFGNFLVINHGYGIVTRYGHLKKSYVKPGKQVHRGDIVACIGSTGRSTGPHVHYEVLINGVHVNPKRYMLK